MDSKTQSALTGNFACFIAYLIFGFNIIFCKNISDCGLVSPWALYLLRAIGALALFWLFSLVLERKNTNPRNAVAAAKLEDTPAGHNVRTFGGIEVRDLWKVAAASFLGLFMTQLAFLKAITMATPMDVAILSLLSPIMTMIVAAIFLKDRINLRGVTGLTISFCGVLFIVLNTVSARTGADETSLGGVLLMIVNTLSFASYVGIFKPLIKKYSVVTFMKWMFIFSTIYALPFGLKDLLAVDYAALPVNIIWQILFVVIGATFISYFLIPIGQKRLKPVIVCMYSYVQPIVAMCISLAMGLDTITVPKLLATILVFTGVTLVNFDPRRRK